MVSNGRAWRLAALFGAALAGVGCPTDEEPRDEVVAAVQTGALNLQIDPGGAGVTGVAYEIKKGRRHYREGSFELDGVGSSFSVVLGMIEAGDDYVLELKAEVPINGGAAKTTCKGSGDFTVTAHETGTIKLMLHCDNPLKRMTIAEKCPIICGIRSLPAEAPLGKRMKLKAASNLTGTLSSPLSFKWHSNGGHLFVNKDQGEVELECTEVGVPTVTVTLSNGDSACGEDRVTLNVSCRRGPNTHRGSAGSAPSISGVAGAGSLAAGGGSGSQP